MCSEPSQTMAAAPLVRVVVVSYNSADYVCRCVESLRNQTESRFEAVIVDKEAHKAIVIGKGGARLKRIASDARKAMEELFGGKVWLETWVKVKSGWADDERALRSLGYE